MSDPLRRTIVASLFALIVLQAPIADAQDPPVIFGPIVHPVLETNPREGAGTFAIGAPGPASPLAPSVLYRFPMLSTDWWHTVNYVDLDPSAGILDWGCHSVSYDGHQGHDIVIRDFVEMDEGRYVVAAAPGTVGAVVDGNFE